MRIELFDKKTILLCFLAYFHLKLIITYVFLLFGKQWRLDKRFFEVVEFVLYCFILLNSLAAIFFH
jgi:hypothetical protein